MENKILHLIYTPFTGVGLIGYRGDEWFRERIQIFKDYTLKSLLNQTNPNFTIWFSFRPEEEKNPQVIDLTQYLTSLGVNYIMTFDGLMYWDDKFDRSLFKRLANCGRIMRRCWRLGQWNELFPSVRELLRDKNSTLPSRLQRSLSEFPYAIRDVVYVYMSRIDSDDMFDSRYIDRVHEAATTPTPTAVRCGRGYIYNSDTKEMAEWNPPTNPPFHTIIFSRDQFFDSEKHSECYSGYKSHEDIERIFSHAPILLDAYCVTTHNPKNHISTIWNHPFRGKIVDRDLIRNFGI